MYFPTWKRQNNQSLKIRVKWAKKKIVECKHRRFSSCKRDRRKISVISLFSIELACVIRQKKNRRVCLHFLVSSRVKSIAHVCVVDSAVRIWISIILIDFERESRSRGFRLFFVLFKRVALYFPVSLYDQMLLLYKCNKSVCVCTILRVFEARAIAAPAALTLVSSLRTAWHKRRRKYIETFLPSRKRLACVCYSRTYYVS